MLGRRIAGSRYRAQEAAGPGSGVDKQTTGLCTHDRQCRLYDVEGAQQIAANERIDTRRRQLPPAACGDVCSGIVDDDVQPPELGPDAADKLFDGIRLDRKSVV